MASAYRLSLRLLLMAFLVPTFLNSCSSASKGSGGQVSKVKTYHLIPTERLRTFDRSLAFERQYLLRGAVTASDQRERAGQYYSFLWKADDRTQPVTVKFQYRQANTGLETFVAQEEVTTVKRSNWTKFQIIGPPYYEKGRVTSWKLTLERGGEVLASQQSYLWE
jgi:hypothetical protein